MHNNKNALHPMKLKVNGQLATTFEFKPTGGLEKEWKFVRTTVRLKAGPNDICLESTKQNGPYIDELFID